MVDKTLDNLVRRAERLRLINKGVLMVQIPIAILTNTPSGLENYLNSKFAAMTAISAGLITAVTARIKLHREKDKFPIDTGVYGIVRHPTYLGFRVISLGLIIYNPSIKNLITGGALLLTSELTARAEEKMMEHIHPVEYLQYKKNVSRWIPYLNKISGLFSSFRT